MLDRSIPFYNTILKCEHWRKQEIHLPAGFSIVPYRSGFEAAWARLECDVGDFDSIEEAEHYFVTTYLQKPELLHHILFAVGEEGAVVGSCIAWQDRRNGCDVSSLHWLIVEEESQGKGLGKALCCAAMNLFAEQHALPVYLHTQPWSWKAIFLYLSLGFKLQKTDSFSHYENEYPLAISALQKIVTPEQYEFLLARTEP